MTYTLTVKSNSPPLTVFYVSPEFQKFRLSGTQVHTKSYTIFPTLISVGKKTLNIFYLTQR